MIFWAGPSAPPGQTQMYEVRAMIKPGHTFTADEMNALLQNVCDSAVRTLVRKGPTFTITAEDAELCVSLNDKPYVLAFLPFPTWENLNEVDLPVPHVRGIACRYLDKRDGSRSARPSLSRRVEEDRSGAAF